MVSLGIVGGYFFCLKSNIQYFKSKNKKRQTKYRTATTVYPCFLPNLGELTGAGRTGLPGAKV
jgi:hypothetical protein